MIARRSRPRPMRRTKRAGLARECASLWSAKVRAKYDGQCFARWFGETWCSGRIEAAHCFPKGCCPAARYELDLGVPLCEGHHRRLGNGARWREILFLAWGADLYAQRYVLAHMAGRNLDLAAVRAELAVA